MRTRNATFSASRLPTFLLVLVTALGIGAAGQSQQPASQDALEPLVGEYVAGTITLTVTLLPDGNLTLLFPGQPLYHLQAQSALRYGIRELPAFAVEFQRD